MKISKVEIQAFRAYDELKDCTFDFTLPNGTTADFVSLYAPNGFGKTSFYDAVEWGITSNIYRFIRQTRIKSYASDEKHLNYELANKKSPHFILRNKNSPADRESFVRLYLLNEPEPKFRSLKKGRIDSSDYHFDEKMTEDIKFRDVILSQDNIDAFLREDDPCERYDKFMNLFGDVDLNRIYTNVLCLIKVNENEIEQLRKQVEKLELDLPKDVDSQVLEKINLRIDEMIKQGEVIEKIRPEFTERDFLDFSNTIAERLVELQNHLVTAKGDLDQICEQQLKKDEYGLLRNKKTTDEARLKVLQTALSKFQELNKAKNRLAHIVALRNQTSAAQKETEDIFRQFPLYLSSIQRITEQSAEMDSQKHKVLVAENELTMISTLLTNAQAELNAINGTLFDIRQRQSDLPSIERSINALTIEIEQINLQLKTFMQVIDTNEKETQVNTEQQRKTSTIFDLISKNDFEVRINVSPEIAQRLTLIKTFEGDLKELNANLKNIEGEIANQTNLNNELKQLIILSSAFVNKSNADTCPVCLHQYGSYEVLSERVLKNPLFNDLLQEKIAAKNKLNSSISGKVNGISAEKREILDLLSRELAALKNIATRLTLQKGQLLAQKEQIRTRLANAEAGRKDLFLKIGGVSTTEYSALLVQQNDEQQKASKLKSDAITELQKKLEDQKTLIESWRKAIQNIENGMRTYRLTEEFINVDQFLRKKGYTNYGTEEIASLLAKLTKDLEDVIADEKLVSEDIQGLAEELKNYNELKLNTDIAALEVQLRQNSEIVNGFETFLSRFLSTEPEPKAINETEVLNNAENNAKVRVERMQALIEELEKIEGFKNNVMPLLRYNGVRDQIEKKSERLSFLTEKLNVRLYSEKNRLATIIDEQIQSFFYEDLINQLYQKIDPHPNYKRIKFKCDFNDNKPKLNVFVTGSEEEHIIPNLYFSTAQTNILSLSIFLAKALNARDENGEQINCIFIDDPIQSLDSINILSTIDLIRSLVVNFGKQIILSTHDENFHILLQKKIPSGLFNSKFLELETFGKVRSDIVFNKEE
ncbi:exonuclease SbcC [Pontibacter ummariensis]|uniref:Exonuclease SbcC n=1 Tax=Pontibacter ummariensis TaxID=1610492 RepID=A0A239FW92_9BACT|nr:SMC family ATPase [Pontibacter ummariensis]PRY11894.1 exonuclease SbcC [Pontibacter ummariensis]SNS61159.1 exonuclease SbcC [Pontibacter ummariensis]